MRTISASLEIVYCWTYMGNKKQSLQFMIYHLFCNMYWWKVFHFYFYISDSLHVFKFHAAFIYKWYMRNIHDLNFRKKMTRKYDLLRLNRMILCNRISLPPHLKESGDRTVIKGFWTQWTSSLNRFVRMDCVVKVL